MSEPLLNEVQDVFRKVFGDPTLLVNKLTTANDVTGWDSLMHMRLIIALEERFAVTFTFNEVSAFKNVGDMAELIGIKSGK